MAQGTKTGGRKKGTPNKTTATVKGHFEDVFKAVGGVRGMTRWAKTEPTEFYKLYAKLLPAEIKQDVKHVGLEGIAERIEIAARAAREA